MDVLRFFDTLCPVAEQVIDVPKIFLEDIPVRRLCREPQLVEQLVEVPTIVSYSSLLQRTVEQHVDIPVPRGRGRLAGLQGSLPGQSSTALPSLERISERIVEQNVEFPVGGGLQDFLPGQSSSATSSSPAGVRGSADGPVEGFFALFHKIKKVRRWARTRGRNCSPSRAHPRRELMWITGLMATTSGSASTPCMGRFGRGCCRTTCSGTRRGNATDGSTAASGWRLWWVRSL